MKSQLTIIPKLTIHPDKITTYSEYHWDPLKPSRTKPDTSEHLFTSAAQVIEKLNNNPSEKFLKSKRSSCGILSKNSIKKINKATEYLILLSNPNQLTKNTTGRKASRYITFITLTLSSPQIHSDNEIKDQLLNQFLVELRKYHKVTNYVWKAEKQKNGNIHFHILIDKFIEWWKLRNKWNRIQNKLGYVNNYQEKMKAWHSKGFQVRADLIHKWDIKKQYNAYLEGVKTDWSQPNSTDIHSVRKVINLKSYISKYLVKNLENSNNLTSEEQKKMLVQGRIWGCNYELSDIKGCQLCVDSQIETELNKIQEELKPFIYNSNYYSVVHISIDGLKNIPDSLLFRYFANYLLDTFSFNGQLDIGT